MWNNIILNKINNFNIIFGANGFGKSTYIKQIALLIIISQIGCYILAEFASICIIDQSFTKINFNDNFIINESSFFVETKDISLLLNDKNNNNTKNSLILIDELGRSTGWSDGYSLSCQ